MKNVANPSTLLYALVNHTFSKGTVLERSLHHWIIYISDTKFHTCEDDNLQCLSHSRKLVKPCILILCIVSKDIKQEIARPVSTLINKSLSNGIVPKSLKMAKVIQIYKAKDKEQLSNYRPISLLPTISKILDTIISDFIIFYSLSQLPKPYYLLTTQQFIRLQKISQLYSIM